MSLENNHINPSEMISGFNLSLDQGIAQKLGLDAALIYNHIVYWLKINCMKQDSEMIEGRYWMYETHKQMADFFGFYSEDQIARGLKKLVDSGLIIKKCLNKNPFDRTSWYTVHDQSILKKSLRNPQNCGMHKRNPAESEPLKIAESEPTKSAECINTTEEQENTMKKQTTEQEGLSVVCSSNHFLSSVPLDPTISVSDVDVEIDPTIEGKTKAFNWFMQIGCDMSSAYYFVQNYSLDYIHQASLYVEKQVKKKKAKNERIHDIIAYLRRTLDEKWWLTQKNN